MHVFDTLVIVVYLAGIMGLGIWFGRHQSRREFFAASGSMGWLAVGLSVMATLFSSNSFVFYPSAAFGNSLRIGLSLVAFTLMTIVIMWVFIPVYSRLRVETAYEYLERRFHVSVRTLASSLFILLRIGWMASATHAASLVVANVADVPQTAVILGIGVVAIAYTMLGGLRAVMWTDVVQFFIFAFTILAALVLIVARSESTIGEMIRGYADSHPGVVVDFEWSMTLQHGSWAILIGVFLESVQAFGADQVAVQRFLSARSERVSRIGAMLNLLGMWIVLPGLLAIGVGLSSYFSTHPAELAAVAESPTKTTGVSETTVPETMMPENMVSELTVPELIRAEPKIADRAMPQFVRLHFPAGLAGLFLAALMAAIMSSIDSGIHSVTTALIVDFRDRLFPELKPPDDEHDVRLIRNLVVIVGVVAVTLACFVGPLGNVFDIGKKVTAAFGGPLLSIFVLALFSRRATTIGVVSSSMIATSVTLLLMYMRPDWYSVWFWPIGFGLGLVLGSGLSFLQPRSESPLTWFEVVRTQKERRGE